MFSLIILYYYILNFFDLIWFLCFNLYFQYYQIIVGNETIFVYLSVKFYEISDIYLLICLFIYMFIMVIITYLSVESSTIGKKIFKELSWFVAFIVKEVEKELINLDDVILLLVLLFIVFSWFFILCIIPIFTENTIFNYILIILPFMCVLTIMIPIVILYDQGMFFIMYLRGAASTSIFILELIYDYISILIMFIRIIIQNLRFFFMFLVYFELQEFIGTFVFDPLYIPYGDPVLGEAAYTLVMSSTIKWFFIYKLPNYLILTYYYIIHMTVIFISNTVAYLFLIFWLYLFLYTCFYTQKFENFFKKRRKKYNLK